MLAAERMLSGGKVDPSATLRKGSQQKNGRSSDIAAEAVGFESGRELERSLLAVKKIDELTVQGRTDDAQLIRNELNNGTASAAEKLAKRIDELSDKDKQDILQKKVSVNKATSKPIKEAIKKAKKAKAKTAPVKGFDNTANDVKEYPKTADDPEGLGLITPKKLGIFDEPIEGSVNIEAVLYADPRRIADFTQTIKHISDWFYYTATCNKENLKTFVNKAVSESKETNHYTADFSALIELNDQLDMFNDIVRPIVTAYTDEVTLEMKVAVEHRKQLDEESAQKRREAAEEQRRRALEQSRQYSQNAQEAKRKSEAAKQEENKEEEW